MAPTRPLPSSFRDRSGFVFSHDGDIYRQINKVYGPVFDRFMASGLYDRLVERQLLIPHEEIAEGQVPSARDCHKIIKPKRIPYVSYPYEWSFSQLKAAALLTLKTTNEALKADFMLKDASGFNVQFLGTKPIFIDTLSFAPYTEGEPWVAYRQFCQHFLAPLALMAYTDVNLSKLLFSQIDGIPLPLASKLLPRRTRLSPFLAMHVHVHAKMQQGHADAGKAGDPALIKKTSVPRKRLAAMIRSLADGISKMRWGMPATEWGDYYENTSYTDRAGEEKRKLVGELLSSIAEPLRLGHDLGANTGEFSKIAARYCEWVVSLDIDPVAVERNYLRCAAEGPDNVLPLVQDLSAPSPAIGWANRERDAFIDRGDCDVLLALALVHHLAVSNNVHLSMIADLFSAMCRWLIIEFVPKSDVQVKRLLATREDVFPDYTQKGFESAFGRSFTLERREALPDCDRILYLMKRRT